MIHYLLESSSCVIVFIAFYYLVLRNKSFHHWNRIYLLGTLILSLAIPLVYIPIEEIIYVHGPFGRTGASAPGLGGATLSWQRFYMISYLIGFCVSLFIFLKELIQIRNIITQSEIKRFPNYTLVELNQEFPLCSFFKYIIVNKNATLSAFELDHELSHIKQKHSYDKIFIEVMTIIFWFNPAIYLYRSSLYVVHEYLADHDVIKEHGQDNYTNYLISALTRHAQHLSTVNPFHSLIKNRLHMLYNKKESTKTVFLMIIPLILCLGFFISCEKVIKLEPADLSIQYPNLEFNDKGEVILMDTVIVFDEETFEEEIKIAANTMSLEEYQQRQMSKQVKNKIAPTTDKDLSQEFDQEFKSKSELLADTMFIYYDEILKEEIYHIPVSVYMKNRLSNFGGRFQMPLEYNNIYVTGLDTIVTFNEDTYEESMKIVKTQTSIVEYEKRLRGEID